MFGKPTSVYVVGMHDDNPLLALQNRSAVEWRSGNLTLAFSTTPFNGWTFGLAALPPREHKFRALTPAPIGPHPAFAYADTCATARNGKCEEPSGVCAYGTDSSDCGAALMFLWEEWDVGLEAFVPRPSAGVSAFSYRTEWPEWTPAASAEPGAAKVMQCGDSVGAATV